MLTKCYTESVCMTIELKKFNLVDAIDNMPFQIQKLEIPSRY